MISIALGLAATGWSALRSSKWAMYAAVAGALALGVLLWRRGLLKEGAARAAAKAAAEAMKRMERNRQIHHDLQTWPLEKRAARLRQLNARSREET